MLGGGWMKVASRRREQLMQKIQGPKITLSCERLVPLLDYKPLNDRDHT